MEFVGEFVVGFVVICFGWIVILDYEVLDYLVKDCVVVEWVGWVIWCVLGWIVFGVLCKVYKIGDGFGCMVFE